MTKTSATTELSPVSALEAVILKLQDERDDLKTLTDKLRGALAREEIRAEKLEDELNALTANLAEITDERNALDHECDRLHAARVAAKAELVDLQDEMERWEADVDKLRDKADEFEAEAEALREDRRRLLVRLNLTELDYLLNRDRAEWACL